MQPMVKVYILDDEKQKVFGEGPYRLLKAVEEQGSLRKAALSMEMAYTKARKLLQTAEGAYGPLVIPTIGGHAGGGSVLTEAGKELLTKYERYRNECKEANRRIYESIFSE